MSENETVCYFLSYIYIQSEPPHGLYLLDSCRISQVSPTSGKTRKKLSSLASVQTNLALITHSPNGVYVGGLNRHGDLFMWRKDIDSFKMYVSPLSKMDKESVKNNPAISNIHGETCIACAVYM